MALVKKLTILSRFAPYQAPLGITRLKLFVLALVLPNTAFMA